MSQFDQRGQHVGRDQYIAGKNQYIAAGNMNIHPLPPNRFTQIWLFLWRHKSALLGVALLCGIALYPLFPPTVNLIAENVSSAPFVLLILTLLGISCLETVPILFGVVFGSGIGFFVGFAGVLLSGLLANALAAHDFPTNVQASFDLTSGQASWIWFLVLYSLLIGSSALLTGFRARGKTAGSLGVSGGVILLVAVGIYLLIAQAFSQVGLSLSALYPLLAVSDQTQILGGTTVLFAGLFVPAGLLLLALPLVIGHTSRIRNWIRAHKWPRYGALAVVLIVLVLPPVYELRNMQTASTALQGQSLPLDIPLTCASCAYPYFQIRLESIESQNDSSRWDITLINPGNGSCIAVAFLPQSITLTNAFFHVYQSISHSSLDNQETIRIDPGGIKTVSLFYQIIPKSAQHLQFALSLHLAPCTGTGNAGDEVQGSQMLLFQ